jgi:chromosome partitioning protein
MYEVLCDGVSLREVILTTRIDRLQLAPARISLAKVEAKLLGEIDGHFRLKDRLDVIRGEYDYVVVDTPPALGLITVNALVAATHLLVPVQSSYFALEGTDDLLETVERIRSRPNPELKLLGAVVTLHDKRTTLSRDVQKAVGDVFGNRVFRTTISKSIRLEESPAHKESIFTFAPQSSGAYEYYQLCEEVIERV